MISDHPHRRGGLRCRGRKEVAIGRRKLLLLLAVTAAALTIGVSVALAAVRDSSTTPAPAVSGQPAATTPSTTPSAPQSGEGHDGNCPHMGSQSSGGDSAYTTQM